jgi:hypothetical protein
MVENGGIVTRHISDKIFSRSDKRERGPTCNGQTYRYDTGHSLAAVIVGPFLRHPRDPLLGHKWLLSNDRRKYSIMMNGGSHRGPEEAPVVDEDFSEVSHSQLPNVEEYKAQFSRSSQSPRSKISLQRRQRTYLITAGVVLLAIVCIIIGVVVGRDTSQSSSSAQTGTSQGPAVDTGFASRPDEFMNLVVEQGWSDPSAVQETDSPQNKACNWLGDLDPMRLEAEATHVVKQRYALLVFYFALEGDSWEYDVNLPWLTELDVCQWSAERETTYEGTVSIGVKCTDQGDVKSIFLPHFGLSGEIPDEIGLLETLTSLALFGNDIINTITHEVGSLNSLTQLDLHDNQLEVCCAKLDSM